MRIKRNMQEPLHSVGFNQIRPTGTKGKEVIYSIFGLIDPRSRRVFHVGYTESDQPQLNGLPEVVADRITELAPAAPQIVLLQTVNFRPEVCLVKWSMRFRRDLLTVDWRGHAGIASAFTNPKRTRRALGEAIPSDTEIQINFHEFDRKNPQVFEEMLGRARGLRDEGFEVCGIDLITSEMRYKSGDTNLNDGVRIPNSFKAFHARKLQMVDPSLCGLFVIHHSVADSLVLENGQTWRDFAREHADLIRFEGPKDTEEDAQ
jgi:hypothetical protein